MFVGFGSSPTSHPSPKMIKRTLLLVAACAATAAAQKPSAVSQAKLLWADNAKNVAMAAEDVPESLYSFRATPEVRTFGEIIGHVAGSQSMFCAMALGEKQPAEDAIEKTAKTKAALVAALKQSTAYCQRAYEMSDASAMAMVDVFGAQRTKLFALMLNAAHDDEHYGNIVTYMRLNKMVPPTSRPAAK